jgi:von Willebrand factor type A C-terminal domain/von Willebrand factor type A domain
MPDSDAHFGLECFHNEYLPDGGRDVDAIITVGARGAGPVGVAGAAAAEVIIVDVSGSMTGKKINEARRATAAAIEHIRDDVRFAVVAGNQLALPVFPGSGFAVADRHSRKQAIDSLRVLKAGGGTAIGAWIEAATELLADQRGVRHAILLTDGRDESERPEDLEAALERAGGVFQCDCRGVGADWEVAELRRIATALLGSVDIVADPSHLAADFEAMMRQAMGKSLADVAVRVWTPQGAEVGSFQQVAPDILDLTSARVDVDARTGDYPTGAWGDESRDYHLTVRVPPGAVGDQMLSARVSVVVDGKIVGQTLVPVTWTDETELSTRINGRVAHYTGQEQLAEAIQEGLDARRNGDDDTAIVKLGRAVQLASAAGNQDKVDMLNKVVDVEDASTGRVRLKKQVRAEDEMTLDTRSTRTARVQR